VKAEAHTRKIDALRRAVNGDVGLALFNDEVIEVLLNPDGRLWIERLGRGMECVGSIDPVRAMQIVAAVAAVRDDVVTADRPVIECELPAEFAGARFEGLIPPVVTAPIFSIRKKALLVFRLDDYVSKGIMTAEQMSVIVDAVQSKRNILICGGTGTGKTTLANAVLAQVAASCPDDRVVVIEDTQELQVAAKNVVFLRTSESVDMTGLLRATMRLRPDRIVVGEVRDRSALALLKAWNTGHPGGVGTVHANDAAAALVRVGQLVQEANVPPAPELIAEAVNVVVSIKRLAHGRIIDQVLSVRGWDGSRYVLERADRSSDLH